MSCTAPGRFGDRDDEAGAVVARSTRLRVAVRMGHDREAGAVVRVVLDRRRHDMQTVLARRVQAGQRAERRSRLAQARAFGIAGDRPTLDARQALAQPGVALGQRLRVGADRRQTVESVRRGAAGCGGPPGWSRRGSRAGAVRNRSSERAITPSVEFSTGTTPKSAAPALVARNTSSMLGQGTRTIDEPKKPSAASSLKVPAGPR